MNHQAIDTPTVSSGVKWFVVVNPISGSGKGLDDFPLISKLLRDNNIRSEAVFTEHKYHATELTVSAINSGYRHIIVVGGDGTLHEVINGLFIQKVVEPEVKKVVEPAKEEVATKPEVKAEPEKKTLNDKWDAPEEEEDDVPEEDDDDIKSGGWGFGRFFRKAKDKFSNAFNDPNEGMDEDERW